MNNDRRIRLLLALLVILALVLAAGGALRLADAALSVLERLQENSALLYYGFIALMIAAAIGAGWLIWWLLAPVKRRPKKDREPITEETLSARIETERADSTDVSDAERELKELARRREAGKLFIALIGEVSTGKSTLIRALVPGATPETSPIAGTTREITHYHWISPSGDELILTDVPGTGDEGDLDTAAMDEALRAHVVLYVTDGDLNRAQYEDLLALATVGKPMIIVLNKADRYAEADLEAVRERVRERVAGLDQDLPVPMVVAVTGGGRRAVVEVGADGVEREVSREREPAVDDLKQAIQVAAGRNPDALDTLRDTAVFQLAARRLDEAALARRRVESAAVVRDYTRKAVVAALAAVSPGTDVLLQGYLGTAMVRKLCEIHDVPAREVDIQRFLDFAQGFVGRALPLMLAVAGNALKAFPGVGTVAGGLVHAVAYGMIFDALGKGLSQSLEESGGLQPATAARHFRENLGEDIRDRTLAMARLALEARRDGDS